MQNPNNMKKFFSLLIAFVAFSVTCAKAQTSLIATLNHEGTMSTFYGSTALQQAHKAAVDGDVVTLSSGTFASENITKAITLRGAGMALDAETQTEPTVLANAFNIEIPDETTQRLTIEGIYTNQNINIKKLRNAMFLKDRLGSITISSSGHATNLTFIHCRNTGTYHGRDDASNSASFINCIVSSSVEGYYYSFKNCIIYRNGQGDDLYFPKYSECKNSIIKRPRSTDDTMSFYNNLYTNNYGTLTNANNTNIGVTEDDKRFSGFFQDTDDNEYKLTEEVKAIMKGTDGTEVGIYGGSLPYDPTPTNPQIIKFNVASKTTADGKLSVDIEVKSAE